ncbi:MAG: hypothetical protein SFW67_11455 [Myxococcaceae bacterium]|nr:hypothetical protein [Myxococcaceae bacterium]
MPSTSLDTLRAPLDQLLGVTGGGAVAPDPAPALPVEVSAVGTVEGPHAGGCAVAPNASAVLLVGLLAVPVGRARRHAVGGRTR